jgi:hypothetical protein
MQIYPEENRTMEIAHPSENSGKHSTECAVVIFPEWSCYCVISLRFALKISLCLIRTNTALLAGRSRVRFPMVSLEIFIDIILPAAVRLWG